MDIEGCSWALAGAQEASLHYAGFPGNWKFNISLGVGIGVKLGCYYMILTIKNKARKNAAVKGLKDKVKQMQAAASQYKPPPPMQSGAPRTAGPRMPQPLIGKLSRTTQAHSGAPVGDPLCFGYNLGKCTSVPAGGRCPKGWHKCAEPGCGADHACIGNH